MVGVEPTVVHCKCVVVGDEQLSVVVEREDAFFDKGTPTKRVWYYQVDKHFTKTAPLTEADMEDFLSKQRTQEDGEHSWSIDVSDLDENYDLSVKNPNKVEEVDERTPREILQELQALNEENAALLKELEEMV